MHQQCTESMTGKICHMIFVICRSACKAMHVSKSSQSMYVSKRISKHVSQQPVVKMDLLIVAAGYGYLRPHVRLFDPGWRGPLVTQSASGLMADYGNDPVGLITRFAFQLHKPSHQVKATLHLYAPASLPWSMLRPSPAPSRGEAHVVF